MGIKWRAEFEQAMRDRVHHQPWMPRYEVAGDWPHPTVAEFLENLAAYRRCSMPDAMNRLDRLARLGLVSIAGARVGLTRKGKLAWELMSRSS